ncbi:hypothetical protein BASA83_002805 [Batrachochytrium salamandrivorans]|nr:hypothetical protein BASA83_002805 [Batrachochytrium salamandrivorans]
MFCSCQWLVDDATLSASRNKHLQYMSADDLVRAMLYYSNLIQHACKRLHIRQPVVGTALVYWRRFFTKNALFEIDPMLVAGTAIYVACKIEECPHHIRNVASEMAALGGDLFPYDAAAIADFEYYLIEELDFSLIMFHPYRPLQQILEKLHLTKKYLQPAWYVINDTYKTDLMLIYPPHMIALAAIFISTSLPDSDTTAKINAEKGDTTTATQSIITSFFLDLSVDMQDILAISQHIFNFYGIWKNYSEEKIRAILNSFLKLPITTPDVFLSKPKLTPTREKTAPSSK